MAPSWAAWAPVMHSTTAHHVIVPPKHYKISPFCLCPRTPQRRHGPPCAAGPASPARGEDRRLLVPGSAGRHQRPGRVQRPGPLQYHQTRCWWCYTGQGRCTRPGRWCRRAEPNTRRRRSSPRAGPPRPAVQGGTCLRTGAHGHRKKRKLRREREVDRRQDRQVTGRLAAAEAARWSCVHGERGISGGAALQSLASKVKDRCNARLQHRQRRLSGPPPPPHLAGTHQASRQGEDRRFRRSTGWKRLLLVLLCLPDDQRGDHLGPAKVAPAGHSPRRLWLQPGVATTGHARVRQAPSGAVGGVV